MNGQTFEMIFNQQVDTCRKMLVGKADEYATDDDRLHNFQVAAALQGTTPQQALAGFMAKHSVSIFDMCREPNPDFPMEKWDEKITDHINYLILLKAVMHEACWGDESQLVLTFHEDIPLKA